MYLREEQSEGLARNPIEQKCEQYASKTVGGRGLPVPAVGIWINPSAPTSRACFILNIRYGSCLDFQRQLPPLQQLADYPPAAGEARRRNAASNSLDRRGPSVGAGSGRMPG